MTRIFLAILFFTTGAWAEESCPDSKTLTSEVRNTAVEAGSMSSLHLTLASGHIAEARDDIGLTIATDISLFNAYLSCPESSARAFAQLRVIAAANNKAPIPHVHDDPKLMAILAKAIAENPGHYEKLVKRSANWEKGIR